MKVLTSNFASIRKMDTSRFVAISIARKPPQGFAGPCLFELAPANDLLWGYKNGSIDKGKYTVIFEQALAQTDFTKIAEKLDSFRLDNKIPVLCCYEKSGDFCHRNLVSKWLREHGIEASEMASEDFQTPSAQQGYLLEM